MLVPFLSIPLFKGTSFSGHLQKYSNEKNPQRIIVPGDDLGPTFQQMSLNYQYNVTLSNNEIGYYYYVPVVSSFFVIETFGTEDTILRVDNTENGTIIDDNSGYSFNSKIYFKGVAGELINIYVKFNTPSVYGNFVLQLRRQYFSMFAYEDDAGLNMIPDLNVPYNSFNDSFKCKKYENGSASHALSDDERHFAKLNSEIMFFSGHGFGTDDGDKGYGVLFKTGSIDVTTTLDMSKTKVAFWSACYSANSSNSYNKSIAQHAYNSGAKSSIGFMDSVNYISARAFTNRFFNYLSTGASVSQSVIYADEGILLPWDKVHNYVVFGSQSLRVTDITISNGYFEPFLLRSQTKSAISIDEFENNLEGCYEKYRLSDNHYRYFDVIDNCLTNSYVDVTIKDCKVVSTNDHRYQLKNVYPIKVNQDDISLKNFLRVDNSSSISKIENHLFYYKNGEGIYPYLLSYCCINKTNFSHEEVVCINLYDGSLLPYEYINEIK